MPISAPCSFCPFVVRLPDGWASPGFTCPKCGNPTRLPRPTRPPDPPRRRRRPPPKESSVLPGVLIAVGVFGSVGLALLFANLGNGRNRQQPPEAAKAPAVKEERRADPKPAADEDQLSAEVMRTYTEPFTNPQGRQFVMLKVRWRNTGNRPIRLVTAVINVEDEDGNALVGDTGSIDYPIYAVASNKPGVAPGEVFVLPAGEGYAIPIQRAITDGKARVRVSIVRVREDGF